MAYIPLYSRRKLSGQLTGQGWTAPATTYIGLFTNVPAEGVPGLFVLDAGLKEAAWTSNIDGTRSNANVLTFGPAGEDWGTICAIGIFDSTGAANLLYSDEAEQIDISMGDQYQIGVGEIVVEIPV